jgi:hypothetical protein
MSTEAARLVDELTTLLYSQFGAYRGQSRVACAACHRKADTPELVVHEDDCPVYRLQRAEAANTAVIRANAEEIADLEDVRDDLEAKVNALTAENARLAGQVAALREAWHRAGDLLPYTIHRADCRHHDIGPGNCSCGLLDVVRDYGRAALAAGQGDGQG